jgi:hypothetical protein
MLDTGYLMLDTGYWILDTRCWMLDTGCVILVAGKKWYKVEGEKIEGGKLGRCEDGKTGRGKWEVGPVVVR